MNPRPLWLLLSFGLGALVWVVAIVLILWLSGCAARPHEWTDRDLRQLSGELAQ